jgi:parallel beta-helix repeat protein
MISKKVILGLIFFLFLMVNLDNVSAKNCGGTTQCDCGDILTHSQEMWYDLDNCQNVGVDGITFSKDNLVLDCKGHAIKGINSGHGLRIIGLNNSIINDCNVENFHNGIFLGAHSKNSTISKNDISSNQNTGIFLYGSDYNLLKENYLEYNGDRNSIYGGDAGIYIFRSNENLIETNTLLDNTQGIKLEDNFVNNILRNNFIERSPESAIYLIGDIAVLDNTLIEGNSILQGKNGIYSIKGENTSLRNNFINKTYENAIYLDSSRNLILENNTLVESNSGLYAKSYRNSNLAFHNNFIENNQNVFLTGSSHNFTFNLEGEGNYWSDFNSASEGCQDINLDGFCDGPYFFNHGVDYFPFVEENGWELSYTDTFFFDNQDPEFEIILGKWKKRNHQNSYNGNARFIQQGIGLMSVGWRVDETIIPGNYSVYVWKFKNQYQNLIASNAKYSVVHSTGTSNWIEVDQTTTRNEWIQLGNFTFDDSSRQGIVLNDNANGYVIADAVKLVYN